MDWYWLVIFAGLMFVMHRFGLGCCGGHSHGGPQEASRKQDAEVPLRAAGEEEEDRSKLAFLPPEAGERKGDG